VFKTPPLREVTRTAPYFHNGGFRTLEEVLEFYVRGGGRAFGHAVPNQAPDVRPLVLTDRERADLLFFLRVALTEEK
jgi:cytochrome c peroxidase